MPASAIPIETTTPTSSNLSDEDDEDEEEWEGDEDSTETVIGKQYKNPRNSPSTLCPRDEEQATLLGQKCSRKCSSDEDCKSKKKKCLCDGLCGMSCIKPDRECPEPEQISYGTVTVTGKLFGDRVTYSCQHGYHVVGLQSRTCQADGQWARTAPSCKQNIYCLAPPTIDHARHNALPEQTTFDLDSTLQYFCHNGYVTNGFPRAKCLAIDGQASWYGPDISCEPRSCGAPQDISHGWHAGECYTYGCRINYHCAEGFELVGKAERFCQADGMWSPKELPTCVPVQCSIPENPRYGKAIYTSCSYNSVVSYECKYGYTLVGEATRRCGADRKWSGSSPVCKAPCVVPQVSQVVPHGEALNVECDAQYEFLASSFPVTCNNGTWTHIPKCQPARCKHLPKSPKHGMVIAPKIDHGMKAKFTCKDGFELKGNELVECSFGNWTGELPICQEVYCPFPGLIDNGKILLVGNMGLYDYRPYVRKITNNKQIMYDCDKGYILDEGPPGATCVGGKWSPSELPKCVLGQHPRLRWSRRRRSLLLENFKRKFAKLNKSIDSLKRTRRALKSTSSSRTLGLGYKSGGSSINLRRNNKKFNNDITFEKEKKKKNKQRGPCPNLPSEPYVNIEIIKPSRDKNNTYGSGTIVKIACGKGYDLNMPENKTAKCVRGKWRPVAPACLIQPCYTPKIDNGIFKLISADQTSNVLTADVNQPLNDTISISNGELVAFSCNAGYNVQGSSNLKCWHGEWTVTTLPECIPAPCLLPQIQNGQYLSGYRAGLTIVNGSGVSFQCDEGYLISTSNQIECALGELFPHNPSCIPHLGISSNISKIFDSPHYLGGRDIVKGGDITDLGYGASIKSCAPPAKVQGSLVYRNGEPLVDNEQNFPDGTEVTFNCIESIMGEKTTWKIICEDGSWIGRSLNCDIEDLLTARAINNNTCIFRNQEPNVLSFYNDQEIREEVVEFPSGAVLISRCKDIGKYAMIGPNKRRCMGGEWDGLKPSCFGLNQENDYSMEKPPTILFRHQNGPIAQSNDGKLIVYPGTVLHMECLWMKRFGNPRWNVSHDYRKYPEGWTADPGRDSQLEYRLSIYHASKDDSGVFTCETPARHTHSVEIIVKAVHCPVVPQRRGLTVNTQSTKMNTQLKFICVNGNALIGAQEITCLPSGNWSAPFPVCESIECGEVGGILPSHLRVTIVSREVGGRAQFSCVPGFGIRGPHETICLTTGEWATPYPTCVEVQCDNPGIPENGYIQGTGPFKAGDVVQFNCNTDYMMEGQPIVACQDNGRWSGPLPKCAQACSYPGTTISGRMSSVKFYYKIGENITFTCDDGYLLNGAAMLKCLKNGKWSNAIPTCILNPSERK
ncbi:WAP-type (Whey Acidic Protein) 'four-disulfide core' [Popillia japonica]|uniref:WAP-type (Whey Acidic Protein) 'four-disulfide core n=1 Tax=Popillia japonica TaxID=7064 RepID=A0AAW1K0A8_POPJA